MPDRLGRFVVRDRLGSGAFGTVYRAFDPSLDREVALKVPQAGLLNSPKAVERFLREARAAARLRHPHIVPLYETGLDDGRHYIASAYIEGTTLADIIEPGGIGATRAAKIALQLAEALHYAHSEKIVHRDVKPANVMLDAKGDAHLMDFGLARFELSEEKITQDGAILGTPAYMAPEQAIGRSGDANAASDQYSLGVTLYELLCGQTPFSGPPEVVLFQVIEKEPERPTDVNPAVPRDLETICLKAMAKVARGRYGDCGDLADDLRRWIDDAPIKARTHGLGEKLRRWAGKNPMLAGLSTSIFGLLAIVAVTSTLQERRAQSARRDAEARQVQVQKALGEADTQRKLAETSVLSLGVERERSEEALRSAREAVARLGAEQERTRRALDQSGRLTARLSLSRGQGLCEQGNISAGLCWMAGGLEIAKAAGLEDLDHAIRANLAEWGQLAAPRVFLQTKAKVEAAAFSPDGRSVVTGHFFEQAARVWDAATGEPLTPPMEHEHRVTAVAFSPDGQLVATGSLREVRAWDAKTGAPVGPVIEHRGRVRQVAFSPDGQVIATSGNFPVRGAKGSELVSEEETARLWKARTGKPVGGPMPHGGSIESLVFSPDGKVLMTGGRGTLVRQWDVATQAPIGQHVRAPGDTKLSFLSPDGRTSLVIGFEKVQLLDARTGAPLCDPLPYENVRHNVTSGAFSSDGRVATIGELGGVIRRWDARTGRPIGAPVGLTRYVEEVASNSDGSAVLAGCGETIILLDMRGGTDERSLASDKNIRFSCVEFDGDKAVTVGGARVSLWDVKTGRLELDLKRAGVSPYRATLSPDRTTILAFGSYFSGPSAIENAAWAWEVASGKRRDDFLKTAEQMIHAVAFTPDGKTAMVADGKAARRWDLASGREVDPPMVHEDIVDWVGFSPDGETILTGSRDGVASVWHPGTGALLKRPLHGPRVGDRVSFSPDGKLIATASPKEMRLWDARTGAAVGRPILHEGGIAGSAIGRDGQTVVIGSPDGTTRIWDSRSGTPIGPPTRHDGIAAGVAIGPDCRTIMSGGSDGQIKIREIRPPMTGDVDQIVLRISILTGMEREGDLGVRDLDAGGWKQRRERLASGLAKPSP